MEQDTNGIKRLKRIDWDVMERLFVLFYDNGSMKKTHISMKLNMGYDKCMRYLEWMAKRHLITAETNWYDKFEYVKLTSRGIEFFMMAMPNMADHPALES